MRFFAILACTLLVGCSNTKPTRRSTGPESPTVREIQTKASRDREAAAIETAELPVEGNIVIR